MDYSRMKFALPLFVVFALLQGVVNAEESKEIQQLRAALAKTMPDLPITSISESPIPGLLELVTGAQVYYITPNGKYVIEGNIIDVERRIDMTAQRKGRTQVAAINKIGDEKMVVYEPNADFVGTDEFIVIYCTKSGQCKPVTVEISVVESTDNCNCFGNFRGLYSQ